MIKRIGVFSIIAAIALTISPIASYGSSNKPKVASLKMNEIS